VLLSVPSSIERINYLGKQSFIKDFDFDSDFDFDFDSCATVCPFCNFFSGSLGLLCGQQNLCPVSPFYIFFLFLHTGNYFLEVSITLKT